MYQGTARSGYPRSELQQCPVARAWDTRRARSVCQSWGILSSPRHSYNIKTVYQRFYMFSSANCITVTIVGAYATFP